MQPLSAQGGLGASWEMTQDDQGPASGDDWSAQGPPMVIFHPKALAVRAVDFDQDGLKDILLGGNNAWGVRISYVLPGWVLFQPREVLSNDDVFGCYDAAVGDLNGDLLPDILVGRRLSTPSVASGKRDTVFLHKQTYARGDCFENTASFSLPNPDPYGETFIVRIEDVDGDAVPEIFTAGNYGIRYFRRNGGGTFDLIKRYCDQDSCEQGLGGYRSLAFADLNGDSHADMVAARMDGKHTRVYTWQDSPLDPFAPSTRDLAFPAAVGIDWTLFQGQFKSYGSIPGGPMNFGVELGDIDLDGALDIVASYIEARNAVYRNDGMGGFSSQALSPPPYPVAYTFAPITPAFQGRSHALDNFLTQAGVGTLPAAGPGGYYVWTYPGVLVNHCTDVSLADVNLDGRLDAGFSNRNEIEDYFADFDPDGHSCGQPGFPCLPDCYDHIFLNVSQAGSIAFDPCVELLGNPNDGTGYGEFAHLNDWLNPSGDDDQRPEWLDANFNNDGPSDDKGNRMWWGLSLAAKDCSQLFVYGGGMDPIHVDLSLSTSLGHSGKTWRVLGSATSMRPLGTNDSVWDYLWNGGAPLYTGTVSWGQANPSLTIPRSVIPAQTEALFFQVEILDGTGVIETTNPLRASLVQ
jgi:hypothetical protein